MEDAKSHVHVFFEMALKAGKEVRSLRVGRSWQVRRRAPVHPISPLQAATMEDTTSAASAKRHP